MQQDGDRGFRLLAAQQQMAHSSRHLARRALTEARYAMAALKAGLLAPAPVIEYAHILRSLRRYGLLGMLGYLGNAMSPKRVAVIDDRGSETFAELNQRVNALANAMRARGFKPGDRALVMTRNHRGFIEAIYAASRCGAQIVMMNTGFSAPQVEMVAEREGADIVIYDEEFKTCVERLTPRCGSWRSWCDDGADGAGLGDGPDTVERLIASASRRDPPRSGRAARIVVLTSGTTGKPKGAGRDVPLSLSPIGGALTMVPFRADETTMISAPMFHALGFTQLLLAGALRSTIVLSRRNDAPAMLDAISRNHASAVVLVPIVLQRLVNAAPEELAKRDFSALRIIYVSGSQLTATLAAKATSVFGPVVYNLYGSTEIAYGTIATPADLAAAPGTVGRVVPGSSVSIVGPDEREVRNGETGRIFVYNVLKFEGYTGGVDKPRFHGKVSSGDVGHFDSERRLFIDGRDDEMVICGGENVFPVEVEEVLASHPEINDVAVLGLPDEEFGMRLKAYVVKSSPSALDGDAVKQFVRENLARYKVPRDVEFLPELPRNATGKVLKRQLKGETESAATA